MYLGQIGKQFLTAFESLFFSSVMGGKRNLAEKLSFAFTSFKSGQGSQDSLFKRKVSYPKGALSLQWKSLACHIQGGPTRSSVKQEEEWKRLLASALAIPDSFCHLYEKWYIEGKEDLFSVFVKQAEIGSKYYCLILKSSEAEICETRLKWTESQIKAMLKYAECPPLGLEVASMPKEVFQRTGLILFASAHSPSKLYRVDLKGNLKPFYNSQKLTELGL